MKITSKKLMLLSFSAAVLLGLFCAMSVDNATADSDPPVVNDAYAVVEGSYSVALGNVLDNDGAGPGATVGKVLDGTEKDVPAAGLEFTTALGGTVKIYPDGVFDYTAPVVDNSGPDQIDSFKYRVMNTAGEFSDLGTVNINITDTVPVAVDDTYSPAGYDPAFTFSANVMDNDTLSEDRISATVQNIVWQVREADGGTEQLVPAGSYDTSGARTWMSVNGGDIWISQDGKFEYHAPPMFSGADTFQYQLNDGDNSPSAWATVTINVPAPPTPPPIVNDAYAVVEGSSTVALGNVLDNDGAGPGAVVGKVLDGTEKDVPAAGLEFTTALGGTVKIYLDGVFDYTAPVVDNSGPDQIDSFKYRVMNTAGEFSDLGTVNINITDTVPVAVDDSYGPAGFSSTFAFSANIMDNDMLSEDRKSATIQNIVWQVRSMDGATEHLVPAGSYDTSGARTLGSANGGDIWISQDGKFEYHAPPMFSGTDTFQYQLNDGDNSPSGWATVNFIVPASIPADTEVTWSVVANGTSGIVTTTSLQLTFNKDPQTLTADDIAVAGATKGALKGTGLTRTLDISNITVANGQTINVKIGTIAGFYFTPDEKSVIVNVKIPLTFTHNAAFDIPESEVGTAITNIDVSGGVSGGVSPFSFSAAGLPGGISISAAGIISGTPTIAGAAGTATITVTDSDSSSKNITISFGAILPTKYNITVVDGSATVAKAAAGDTVSITADALAGYVFVKWTTTDGVVFTDENNEVTTFTMPANAVTVTATFKAIYAVTVNDGTADKAVASAGEIVTITADAAPAWYVFDKWTTTDGAVFAGENDEITTFTMPANAVTVTATYKAIYTVTVNDGTSDKAVASAGDIVTVTADTAPIAYEFDKWTTTDGAVFADENDEITTFTMPANAVTITATYKPILYAIDVQDDGYGTAAADAVSAAAGTEITLTATANNGYRFKEWEVIAGGITITANKFDMPIGDVTVKAIFEKIPAVPKKYKITAGADQTWEKGSAGGLTVVSDGDPAMLKSVKVDSVHLDASDYTVTDAGGATVTLKASYLETLAEGAHTLELVFADGKAWTLMIINAKSDVVVPEPLSEAGGSDTLIWILFGVAIIAVIGCAAVVLLRGKT